MFVKILPKGVQVAKNAVHTATYELLATEKDNIKFPVDGWKWYDTTAEAIYKETSNVNSLDTTTLLEVLEEQGLTSAFNEEVEKNSVVKELLKSKTVDVAGPVLQMVGKLGMDSEIFKMIIIILTYKKDH